VAKPAMTAAEVAKVTAQAYTDHYAGINQGATQSAVKSASLSKLLSLLSDWANAVMAANETALVKSARSQAQSFYTSDNKDLLHYARLIDAGTKNPAVKSKGAALESFLTSEVITANAVTGDEYKDAYGLAIYIPNYSYNSDYNGLAWAKDGAWAKFAQWQKNIRDDSGYQASR
ncbi:MAG: hypothetical protein HY804_00975, partial [Nitrospinae bacterium]|nr:hypothetical protein [Nitrospinota bacterium]